MKLCRMNLAIHGLEGDVRESNTYYEDLHQSTGQFDFVLANPPFNVNAVDKERLTGDVGQNRRFPFGFPRTDNANYLWIQLFYSALNDKGRAGFIMANSASDARSSEQDLRRQLVEDRGVDLMVAVGQNMFYTVTLPCTLWFLNKEKAAGSRKDNVLFIDAGLPLKRTADVSARTNASLERPLCAGPGLASNRIGSGCSPENCGTISGVHHDWQGIIAAFAADNICRNPSFDLAQR